jgi:N-acetylglutamate synthase-like GNAT family acetyltransferase
MDVSEQVRRAKLEDLGEITRLAREASQAEGQVDEAEVTEWLFGKGVWVAIRDQSPVGVAAWQAENLLAVTDVFHVAPAEYWLEVGSQLLETIEGEAHTLMCEANVVLLPALAPEAARILLQQQGYERNTYDELHRIWREVLSDFGGDELEIMVKRLRDRMVMIPL